MHTKEVICWNCQAPNQVEDNAPELLEALVDAIETIEAECHPHRGWHYQAREAIRKAKERP
jgi:hypothetical protein